MPETPGPTPKNLFERYQPYRRRAEVAFWVLLMALQAAFNCVVAVIDADRAGRALPTWQPVTWELSSHLVLLALVPAVVAFERRFPLGFAGFARNLPWHLAGSVVFSLLHVAGMVALRKAAYAWAGGRYDFGGGRAVGVRIPQGRARLRAVPDLDPELPPLHAAAAGRGARARSAGGARRARRRPRRSSRRRRGPSASWCASCGANS